MRGLHQDGSDFAWQSNRANLVPNRRGWNPFFPGEPIVRYAVSYSRWSRAEQGEGDSLRRQQREFLSFCRKHGLEPLPDHEHLVDDGVSGFTGRNATAGALGQFLTRAKYDPALAGIVLVIEAQDRFSREMPWDAMQRIKEFTDQGIDVGDCRTDHTYDAATFKRDCRKLRDLLSEGELAFKYSEHLSLRLKSARSGERERARKGELIGTGGSPFWLKLSADRKRWELLPEQVAKVRLIFKLACSGKGANQIMQELERRSMASPQGKLVWHPNAINRVIRGKAVLGQFQPCTSDAQGRSIADGESIENYYPRLIDQKTFDKANTLVTGRNLKRSGRPSSKINIFRGLLFNAGTGAPFHIRMMYPDKEPARPDKYRMLRDSYKGGGSSLNYEKLVEAFVQVVEEIDPNTLVEPDSEVQALAEELASLDAKLATIEARIKAEKDIGYLLDTKRDLTRDKQATRKLLDEAEAKHRNPVRQSVSSLKAGRIDDPQGYQARLRLAVERITMHVFRIKDQDGRPRKAAWVEVSFRRDIKRAFAFSYRDGRGFLEKPVTMGGTIRVADGKWEFVCGGSRETGAIAPAAANASKDVGGSKRTKVR
jgi:DNA invertase Pin-like site-specific DNA recombinase